MTNHLDWWISGDEWSVMNESAVCWCVLLRSRPFQYIFIVRRSRRSSRSRRRGGGGGGGTFLRLLWLAAHAEKCSTRSVEMNDVKMDAAPTPLNAPNLFGFPLISLQIVSLSTLPSVSATTIWHCSRNSNHEIVHLKEETLPFHCFI